MSEKVLITWSGGKDSTLALYEMQMHFKCEIVALLTTITMGYERISMHGVRRELLEHQAESLGYQLETVYISKKSSNEEYEQKMEEVMIRFKDMGVTDVIFGDIFLADVRKYRETNLEKVGMNGIFPLWKRRTDRLAEKFVTEGFKAIVTCVDTEALDGSFAGRLIDRRFLSELPDGVDHCGENGEFHSFVYDGPNFKQPIEFEKGEIVLRDKRFNYCDLIPPEED